MTKEKLFTAKEAAEELRLNIETIYRMCRNPMINFGVKYGGSWRIRQSDIDGLNFKKVNGG